MGDVDDAAATGAEHVDDLEQVLDFVFGQGRGGLVKDDDLGVVGNRLGDLHHLTLGNGHGGHDGLGIDIHAQLLEDLHGGVIHLLLGSKGTGLGEAAQPHVVHDVALEGLVQLLMHHGHAVFQGFLGIFEVDFLAVQVDVAGILVVDTEQALHQGGLTGAVFAHQCVNRTGLDRQVDAVQSLDAGELLDDSFHAQQDSFLIVIQMIRLLVSSFGNVRIPPFTG